MRRAQDRARSPERSEREARCSKITEREARDENVPAKLADFFYLIDIKIFWFFKTNWRLEPSVSMFLIMLKDSAKEYSLL